MAMLMASSPMTCLMRQSGSYSDGEATDDEANFGFLIKAANNDKEDDNDNHDNNGNNDNNDDNDNYNDDNPFYSKTEFVFVSFDQ
jgi:hypothetical protein